MRILSLSHWLVRTMASCNVNKLENLKFDNLALKSLPLDQSKRPGSRRVPGACFSLVDPSPVDNPKLVVMSSSAMKLLDIDDTSATTEELGEYFSGNKKLPGSETAAHCYCGHQFGSFSGQLGDGAAIYLGEVTNNKNEKWEIQIKGAGPTPYSRSSDGRKVLRSSIREFLCSEAMFHLGVPTTRAGTLVTSDSLITRDMFYDGRARREKCSMVLRIAPTFLRFGSFEIFKPEDQMTGRAGPSTGRTDILHKMLDYSTKTFYPQIHEQNPDSNEERYFKFYAEVCSRTAELVAHWQSIGFCHGVLNTDNMSIMGLTIDYGPFGFLDRYDPNFICNTSDENGRYSFTKQPDICCWNLKKFAEAIKDALPMEKSLDVLNEVYYRDFNNFYFNKMRRKLGLTRKNLLEDEKLIQEFLSTMEETCADYTNTCRNLNLLALPGMPNHEDTCNKLIDVLLEGCASLENTREFSKPSFDMQQIQAIQRMMEERPEFIRIMGGIDAGMIEREIEKSTKFQKLQNTTEAELKEANVKKWSEWIVKYKERLMNECEDVDDIAQLDEDRKKVMNSNNPKYILRNYIAQNAIEEAEKGNFLEVRNVLRRLEHPYDEGEERASLLYGFNNILYNSIPPQSALSLRVS